MSATSDVKWSHIAVVQVVGGHHGLSEAKDHDIESVAHIKAAAASHFQDLKMAIAKIFHSAVSVREPFHFYFFSFFQLVALYYVLIQRSRCRVFVSQCECVPVTVSQIAC